MFNMYRDKPIIDVKLHCPDGLDESLGFILPDDLDEFLKYVSDWSKEEGYSFTAKRISTEERLAELLELQKRSENDNGEEKTKLDYPNIQKN